MCECDIDIINDAQRVGRAHYVCPKCNTDISLLWFLVSSAGIVHKDDMEDKRIFQLHRRDL